MIILIRHAQSEGNKNRDIHQTTPDHRVRLTPEGHRQAQEAGQRLRELLRPDDTLHFFTSPYRRTRETTEGILESLTSDSPSPSPFPRHTIKVYEEPRLREQDFGNFQPCSAEMERMWMERADYGHFFYRIPNGESAADAYDRVSGFNESLWRLFGEDDFASVNVLVTHGLMTRVFLMKWYHWSVEYFEDLRNINHCEFVILTHNPDNGKYTLQNKLRTWSDLRKERDHEKNLEREGKGLSPVSATPATDHIPIRRKWGGCPDGCTHGLSAESKRSMRSKLAEQMRNDNSRIKAAEESAQSSKANTASQSSTASPTTGTSGAFKSPESAARSASKQASNDDNNATSRPTVETRDADRLSQTGDSSLDAPGNRAPKPLNPIVHAKRESEDHSSSSTYHQLALLHLGGRDGGGSLSGANSLAASDDEADDLAHRNNRNAGRSRLALNRVISHDHGEDGDDELSTAPGEEDAKRLRPHNHHHHHYHHNHHYHTHHRQVSSTASQPPHRMANILGDGDDASATSDTPDSGRTSRLHTHPNTEENPSSERGTNSQPELSLEAQQKEDQSIRGSVY